MTTRDGRGGSMLRRQLLRALGGAALAAPLFEAFRPRRARAAPGGGKARRLIVFYFPDGVPRPDGGPDLWGPQGDGASFTLPPLLSPLDPYRSQCVFFEGLSLGPTDSGSHPGGAKKLLTGVDGGQGVSIDRHLASGVGADAPFPHVYLGAMAAHNNASGDKFISYPSAGTTAAPIDDPMQAFAQIFKGSTPGAPAPQGPDPIEVAVVDSALGELSALQSSLGAVEKSKLDLHIGALHELEKRIKNAGQSVPAATCDNPAVDVKGIAGGALYDPTNFPVVLRAQIDLLVQAMACGFTRVGVVQASQHTSELIMSKFPGTDLFDPNYDMRSHQASHYGQPSDTKFGFYTEQRRWFVEQFAYLLGQLKARPEGEGTMLDHSLVLLCSEVSDGNVHSHDNMPFILAGGAGGAVQTGRVMRLGYRRHSDLLLSVARAMGDSIGGFGADNKGPIEGLLAQG